MVVVCGLAALAFTAFYLRAELKGWLWDVDPGDEGLAEPMESQGSAASVVRDTIAHDLYGA